LIFCSHSQAGKISKFAETCKPDDLTGLVFLLVLPKRKSLIGFFVTTPSTSACAHAHVHYHNTIMNNEPPLPLPHLGCLDGDSSSMLCEGRLVLVDGWSLHQLCT